MAAFLSPRQAAQAAGTRVLTLSSHQLLRLERPERLQLRVRRGELWITRDGDARDVIARVGDCYTFADDTPVVVSAFSDGAEFEARRLPAGGGAWSRLAAAVASLRGRAAAGRLPEPVRGGC